MNVSDLVKHSDRSKCILANAEVQSQLLGANGTLIQLCQSAMLQGSTLQQTLHLLKAITKANATTNRTSAFAVGAFRNFVHSLHFVVFVKENNFATMPDLPHFSALVSVPDLVCVCSGHSWLIHRLTFWIFQPVINFSTLSVYCYKLFFSTHKLLYSVVTLLQAWVCTAMPICPLPSAWRLWPRNPRRLNASNWPNSFRSRFR